MVVSLMAFVAGVFAWTLVEYALHGWMSHRFVTFATPLHQVHHRDPSAVFAIGAWLPTAAIVTVLLIAFGTTLAMRFILGLVAGFAIYELIHYRFHFARPANRFEMRLRTRHLAHHFAIDDRCLGVTTAFWDRLFGTEPDGAELAALAAQIRQVEPLTCKSNLARAIDFAHARLRPLCFAPRQGQVR
jgi:sterol desaturase/sphingolipid hydroxylase (fatty acid hydroxylase superfamily)